MKLFKKICIISSTRADYGLFKDLIKEIRKNSFFKTSLLVTGSHLSKKHGFTVKEVKKDKVFINYQASIISGDNVIQTSSKALIKYGNIFKKSQPDLILILGDRYEILCAAYVAVLMQIPIAHFHGGELTLNSYDNQFRHAISKLSNIHFASTKKNKQRLIQMGEEPARVFNVGSIGLDKIKSIKLYTRDEIQKITKIKLNNNNIILFTFHPETLNAKQTIKNISICLESLKYFKNFQIIITLPNNDLGSFKIIKIIKNFCKKNNNFNYFSSLGRKLYLSCVKQSNIVVGNSSSGIIEVPSLKKVTLDLGDRQKGRERSASIFHCNIKKKLIIKNIKKINQLNINNNFRNPYYKKNSIKKVIGILNKIDLSKIKKNNFKDLIK